MKTALVFLGLLAIAAASTANKYTFSKDVTTKNVDAEFIARQKKVFDLLQYITQINTEAEYYKVGHEFDIESNIDLYTNKKAVQEFLYLYKDGMLPKHFVFSAYNDKMVNEAIALYHVFFYAKDFDTFYKTACWARLYLNEGLFTYAFSIAVIHRADTQKMILPAPYEVYPYFFINADMLYKMYRTKMQEGLIQTDVANKYGIFFEDNTYTFYYNSTDLGFNNEKTLTYFTEDVGLNTYYYYFHARLPFWMNGEEFAHIKDVRGEFYFFFYQQLLARYYMERLTNGFGEIPTFEWEQTWETGYSPNLIYHNFYPFVQRNDFSSGEMYAYTNELKYVENYENQFLQFIQQGFYKNFNTEIDLTKPESINFVTSYWFFNSDLYKNKPSKNFEKYYNILANVLLGGAAKPFDKHFVAPVVLEQFQTALRDPMFYQLYARIMYYFLEYKKNVEPYTPETLAYEQVKINDVEIDYLTTYFEYFYLNADNAIAYSKEEFKNYPYKFLVRQSRINHKPFDVKIELDSKVASEVVVKFFMAPKYDSQGNLITLENNWMNFYQLDWFKYQLTAGKNTIVRNSEKFNMFKQDSLPVEEIMSMMEQGKVPFDMSEKFDYQPYRLMLPKGSKSGFEVQFFVIVYPYVAPTKTFEGMPEFVDQKTIGYPFDLPISTFYNIPNVYFKDVSIFHKGADFPEYYNNPEFKYEENYVPKN